MVWGTLSGVSQNKGYLFGGPHSKDCDIWGFILESPYFGKVPNRNQKDIDNFSGLYYKVGGVFWASSSELVVFQKQAVVYMCHVKHGGIKQKLHIPKCKPLHLEQFPGPWVFYPVRVQGPK